MNLLAPVELRDALDRLRDIRPFVYVASPYSKYPGGLEAAFQEASRASAWLLLNGVKIFCPIAHSHPISVHGQIDPVRHDIWLPADQPLMDAAGGVAVVMMESWRESYGIAVEIETFAQHHKPVLFLRWPREEMK